MNELFTNGNINFSIIGLAALGYVVNLLKGIPFFIMNLIEQRFGYDYKTDSNRKPSYAAFEDMIRELKPNLVSRHRIGKDLSDTGIDIYGNVVSLDGISPGRYVIFKDWTVYTIYKHVVDLQTSDSKNNTTFFKVTLTAVGKNAHKTIDRLVEKESANIYKMHFGNNKYLRINIMSRERRWDDDGYRYTAKRSLSTIFNKEKDIVMKHINIWLNNKHVYQENGLTWKTGILLYGKPGTGKTSIIKGIASELGWTIHVMDQHNLFLIDTIKPKSIIVFEEIDGMCPKAEDGVKISPVSSNGFLKFHDPGQGYVDSSIYPLMQILDGLGSKDGIIFIATTNHIDQLDPALIRPGRFDLKLEMNYIEREYAVQMIEHYGLNTDDFDLTDEEYNPAELQVEIFRKLGIQGDVEL